MANGQHERPFSSRDAVGEFKSLVGSLQRSQPNPDVNALAGGVTIPFWMALGVLRHLQFLEGVAGAVSAGESMAEIKQRLTVPG